MKIYMSYFPVPHVFSFGKNDVFQKCIVTFEQGCL